MKDQFVIAYLPTLSVAEHILPTTLYLAQMLNKGIILLHIADKRYGNDVEESMLKALQDSVREEVKQSVGNNANAITVDYCLLRQPTRKAIDTVATVLNGVIIVAATDPTVKRHDPLYPKELLSNLSESKIAYLTLPIEWSGCHKQGLSPYPNAFRHVGLSIDFKKESKEKLVWASYFARFNKSAIEVYFDNYRDSGLKQKWYNNMKFLTKFFNGLGLTYSPHSVEVGNAVFPETVLQESAAEQCDLFISTTTDLRARDTLEFFIGTQEMRVIRNVRHLPTLFLNPRDDIYVLCD